MVDVASEQEVLVGEIVQPEQLTRRSFATLDALADYIKTFQITNGGFAFGNFVEYGQCYLLEYPARSQD